MARRDRTEESLAALRAAREQPRSQETLALLRRSLAERSSFVVAAAADLIAAAELGELLPLLPPAFARFLVDPVSTDKGCKAKTAIAQALYRLSAQEVELFRQGLRHVQHEPVWGGQQDTAAELRGVCALALAALDAPDVLIDLAELLADPEPAARANAARALGTTGREGALPLLRYKALAGDASIEVKVECFSALLALDPGPSLEFVAGFLMRGEETSREAAALALGQSKDERALAPLVGFAERSIRDRRTALLAIAMLRTPAALDHLLGLLSEGSPRMGADAIAALALHRHDEALRQRVETAVRTRGEALILQAFAAAFPPLP